MIIFSDFNVKLCHDVLASVLPNVVVAYGDILRFDGVIVTASNPMFSMGGGLDAVIAQKYPAHCYSKQKRPGYNERVANVIFAITVNEQLKATPELVREALQFALANYNPEKETLLLTGLGTGIGGLPEETFIELLHEQLTS